MSYSSLWVMDKNYKGILIEKFQNSWLFSPIIWDKLYEKYITYGAKDKFGNKKSFLIDIMFDKTVYSRLNEKINNSENFYDKILWELTNQQIFFTKDKNYIENAIKEFINNYYLEEHIKERFLDVLKAITNINEEEYPYLIFKNTSVDDIVEYWFEKYNNETEEYEERLLNELNEHVADFIIIEDNNIKFVRNIDYFK